MPKRKLVERLRRNLGPSEYVEGFNERTEAADEIERLHGFLVELATGEYEPSVVRQIAHKALNLETN